MIQSSLKLWSMGRRRIKVIRILSTKEFSVLSVKAERQQRGLYMPCYWALVPESLLRYWVVKMKKPGEHLTDYYKGILVSSSLRPRLFLRTLREVGSLGSTDAQLEYLETRLDNEDIYVCLDTCRMGKQW